MEIELSIFGAKAGYDDCTAKCPLLAQSGHLFALHMSASDPKRTSAGQPGMKNNYFLHYYSNERARAKGNGYEPKYCFA
jgi:hypothetical protein